MISLRALSSILSPLISRRRRFFRIVFQACRPQSCVSSPFRGAFGSIGIYPQFSLSSHLASSFFLSPRTVGRFAARLRLRALPAFRGWRGNWCNRNSTITSFRAPTFLFLYNIFSSFSQCPARVSGISSSQAKPTYSAIRIFFSCSLTSLTFCLS